MLIGGGTLWAMVLVPTLTQLAPTLPKGALPTLAGRVLRVQLGAAVLTLLAGAAAYGLMQARWGPPWNQLLLASFALMLVLTASLFLVVWPMSRRMARAMAGMAGPPGPEMAAMRGRMMKVSVANLGLGWTLVVLMVAATALRTT